MAQSKSKGGTAVLERKLAKAQAALTEAAEALATANADARQGNAAIPLAGAVVSVRRWKSDPTKEVLTVESGGYRQRFDGGAADRAAFALAVSGAVIVEPPIDPEEEDEEEPV